MTDWMVQYKCSFCGKRFFIKEHEKPVLRKVNKKICKECREKEGDLPLCWDDCDPKCYECFKEIYCERREDD